MNQESGTLPRYLKVVFDNSTFHYSALISYTSAVEITDLLHAQAKPNLP